MDSTTNLNILDYCADRVSDIELFKRLLSASKQPETVWVRKRKSDTDFKSETIHRRRTTSHVRYRIPTSFRLSTTRTKKVKLGVDRCRNHRRRPNTLFHEAHNLHATSSISSKWLETHLWHRKRMHMSNVWGCVVPLCNQSRGFSFVRTAVKRDSIVMDCSFTQPIEVSGPTANSVLRVISAILVIVYAFFV